MTHSEAHVLAGQTVALNLRAPHPQLTGENLTVEVEDYWDRVSGTSWMFSDGNFAAMLYGLRIGSDPKQSITIDDEVVYGKVDGLGHLIHVSELGEPV